MSSKRFPKVPDVSEEKPAKPAAKKTIAKSFTDLTNNSSFSVTKNTFSEQDSEELLHWIEGLKNRASNLFEKQRNELVQLRKDAHREHLRQKYREHIDSTSFDKLGELLEREETGQNGLIRKRSAFVSGQLQNRGSRPISDGTIGSNNEESQDYSFSEQEEEENDEFQSGAQTGATYHANDNIRLPEYDQEDDDIVEILSGESVFEEGKPGEYYEESDEDVNEEIEDSEELISSVEEYDKKNPSNFVQHNHQGVPFHVQNGRPRLSDMPTNFQPNYDQNYDEDNLMESEDLDAVEDKYSDDMLEHEVERELETHDYSGNEKESYHGHVEQGEDEDVYSQDQYTDSGSGEENDANDQGYKFEHTEISARPVSPSANLFENENRIFQEDVQMEKQPYEAEEKDEKEEQFVVLTDASSSPAPEETENSFHDFSEEDRDINSKHEHEHEHITNPSSEVADERSMDVEEVYADAASGMSGSDSEHVDEIASSPENPELSDFLSQLQDESQNNNLFANLAQEALAAHTEADFNDEINAALQEGAQQLVAEQQANSLAKDVKTGTGSSDIEESIDGNIVDTGFHDTEVESKDEAAATVDVPDSPPNVRFLSFQTIAEEDPKTVLKQLKATERKFHIKLDAVEKLTSEVGEVSDPESFEKSSPGSPQSSFYDVEVPEPMIVEENISSLAEENTGSFDMEDSVFQHGNSPVSPVKSAAKSNLEFFSKPEVPVLADIEEGDDEVEVESSSDSDISVSVDNTGSLVVVVEPVFEEDVLTVYDEFTEVEHANILAPSGIEEPVAETGPDSFSEIVLEFVSEVGDEASVNPTEIIEPEEVTEDLIVETFEEILDFAVPTSIIELESMRNTPVSTAAPVPQTVDIEIESDAHVDALKKDDNVNFDTSNEASEQAQSPLIQPDEDSKWGIDPEDKLEKLPQTPSEPQYDIVEKSETQLQGPDVVSASDIIEPETEPVATDPQVLENSDMGNSAEDGEAGNKTTSPISRLFGKKRKSDGEDRDTSSSPVKKLKKAFSKLNPFKWRLSEGPSLHKDTMDSFENDHRDSEDIETEETVSASEGFVPSSSEFNFHSFVPIERTEVPEIGAPVDVSAEEKNMDHSLNSQDVNENMVAFPVENGEDGASNEDEDAEMEELQSGEEISNNPEGKDLHDIEEASKLDPGFSQQVSSPVSSPAKDIEASNMDIETETVVNEPTNNVPAAKENESEDIGVEYQEEQHDFSQDTEMDEEIPVAPENTILLSVPPLPRPISFMRIAEANREEMEDDMHVDSDHSSKSLQMPEKGSSATEKLHTLVQPVSEVVSYIDDAVTSLVQDSGEESVADETDEANYDQEKVDSGSDSHDEEIEVGQNDEKSESNENFTDQGLIEDQDATGEGLVERDSEIQDKVEITPQENVVEVETEDLKVPREQPEIEHQDEMAVDENQGGLNLEEKVETVNEEEAVIEQFHDAEDVNDEVVTGSQENTAKEMPQIDANVDGQVEISSSSILAEDIHEKPAFANQDDHVVGADGQIETGKMDEPTQIESQVTETLQEESEIPNIAIEGTLTEPVVSPSPEEELNSGNGSEVEETELPLVSQIKTPSINLISPSTDDIAEKPPITKTQLSIESTDTTMKPAETDVTETAKEPEQIQVHEEDVKVPEMRPISKGVSNLIHLLVKKAEEKIDEKLAHNAIGESDFQENKDLVIEPEETAVDETAMADEEKTPLQIVSEPKLEDSVPESETPPVEAEVDGFKETTTDETEEIETKSGTHVATNEDVAGFSIEETESEKVDETLREAPETPVRVKVQKEAKTPKTPRTPRTPRITKSSSKKRETPQRKADVSTTPVTRVLRNQTTAGQGESSNPPISPSHKEEISHVPENEKQEKSMDEHGNSPKNKSDVESQHSVAQTKELGEKDVAMNILDSPRKRTRLQSKLIDEDISIDSEKCANADAEGGNSSVDKDANEEKRVKTPEHSIPGSEDQKETGGISVEPKISEENSNSNAGIAKQTKAPKKRRGRPPKNRASNAQPKDEDFPDLSQTPTKPLVAKSAPLKKKGRGRGKGKGKREKADSNSVAGVNHAAENEDDHLKIPTEESEDHPALRTRSRSPIKRSIQELSTEIDQAHPRKKRNLRQRNSTKNADEDNEAQQEQEARGRTRKR